jgi:hypothetical protein
MALGRLETLHEVFRPKIVRIWSFVVGAVFLYDVLCNQFGLPKLAKLWGMSGDLMPWRGWLTLLQLGITYGLFEMMRSVTVIGPQATSTSPASIDLTALEDRIAELEQRDQQPPERSDQFIAIDEVTTKLERDVAAIASAVAGLVQPLLVSRQLRELEATEIPAIYPPKLQKILMTSDGPPEVRESDNEAMRWSDTLRTLPRLLTEIVQDESGQLEERLDKAAADIRGNALYTTLTDDDRDIFATPELKQRWHIRKASLEILESYKHTQLQQLRAKIPADFGTQNALAKLDELAAEQK